MAHQTPRSDIENLKVPAPSILNNILETTEAEYVQLLFKQEGESKFRTVHHIAKKGGHNSSFNKYLKQFEELKILKEALYEPITATIDECFGLLTDADDSVVTFVFVPVSTGLSRLGVLILAFDHTEPDVMLSEELLKELEYLLNYEKRKIDEEKERLYRLSKLLLAVQEPKLLGDILKFHIHPMFNLVTSGIICARDGKAASEYQFFFNQKETFQDVAPSGQSKPAPVVGAQNYTYLYEVLRRSDESLLFFDLEFDRYADKEEMHPFFDFFQQHGYRNATIVNLVRGTETVGYWVMIFNKGAGINDLPTTLVEMIAIQLATAVHGINKINQLLDVKKESEVFQSLNMDLAATRDKKNLLKLIRKRLHTLFQFSHHFIFKINDDQMTVSPMLLDPQSRSQYHPSYHTVTTTNIIADGVWNKVLISSEPVIFDLIKLNERGQLPLYLQVNYESGIKKVIMLGLRVDSRIMGIWCIAFTEEQPILPKYLDLIKTTAAPISIAVSNISANESLREREAERDKLMDLSFDLTSIRNKNEFIATIDPFLRKSFEFKNLSIFIDQDNYDNRPFIYLSSDKTNKNMEDFISGEETQFRENRSYIQLFDTTDISVVEIGKLITRTGELPFLTTEYEEGCRSAVVIPLRNDNRRIGLLCIYLAAEHLFNDLQLSLFKEVSYQIAKTVSNILFNEEIARRDKEKELLLALSEEIAAVRDKDQLIKVVNECLKPVLKFAHISLSMKSQGDHVTSFLTDPDSLCKDHARFKDLYQQDIHQCAGFVKFIDQSTSPVVVSPKEQHGFKDIPKFLTVNFESGIKEIVIAKLSDGISVFGYWVLCYETAGLLKANQYDFLQGIANQFSTAISNIRTNQEITDRQKENELLISLSNQTAGLRNYYELKDLVSLKLKSVFKFEGCFIGKLNDDGATFAAILPGEEPGERQHLAENISGTLAPGLLLSITDSEGPLILDRNGDNGILWKVSRHGNKIKNAVLTKFMHNGRLLAFWVMFYDDIKAIDQRLFRLLQGISDQLSIAVANIAGNEKLAQGEWQKSTLLSLSNKISFARTPTELLSLLIQDLKDILKFSSSSILLFENNEKTFGLPWVYPPASKSSNHPRYHEIASLPPAYHELADEALKSPKPFILEIASLPEPEKMPLCMQISFECGMTHVAFIKLIINNEILGLWLLWYDIKPIVTQTSLSFMEEAAKISAVPIFNISFNEKINRREQEKSNLLDFTNAIAGVKDKFQLRKIFHHYLKNLCLIDDLCLHWFTEDKQSQFCYFWDENGIYTGEADFDTIISALYPVDDLIFRQLTETEVPKNLSIRELMIHPEAPPYLKFLDSSDVDNVIGVPLYKGQEMVGILFVKEYNSHTADQPLFKGLCAQLAIAVSDLIATEKVHRQLAEINKYKERLEEEKVYLKQELETSHHYAEIIGDSVPIKRIFHKVSQVSASDSTVLILGETGTGKELIARAIHNNSPRKNKLMVKVNCAALPASLIESELFGHERGSFTGASEKRIGKFELASGGTLFLDEIGELPLELQVKFLRALQEREIERIGGKSTIKVDVRIIVATNRNLELEITEGRFRSDLYFRLSTFPILLPSLRERKDDIPILAGHFVNRFAKKMGKAIDTINQKVMADLAAYHWPGNIRELEHQMERCVLMTSGNTIKTVELPAGRALTTLKTAAGETMATQTIDDHERELILRTLKQCRGKVSGPDGASAILGVPTSTLNSKIKRLGIKKNFTR